MRDQYYDGGFWVVRRRRVSGPSSFGISVEKSSTIVFKKLFHIIEGRAVRVAILGGIVQICAIQFLQVICYRTIAFGSTHMIDGIEHQWRRDLPTISPLG